MKPTWKVWAIIKLDSLRWRAPIIAKLGKESSLPFHHNLVPFYRKPIRHLTDGY